MAATWFLFVSEDTGNGNFTGELFYDPVAAQPVPLQRVRYQNDGEGTARVRFWNPASLPEDQPTLDMPIPPGTPLTQTNVQNAGLTLVTNPRYPTSRLMPNGWRLGITVE